jgi:hypothetical protein
MGEFGRNELKNLAASRINDNTEQEISAEDVRSQTNDNTDSCLNIKDDRGIKYAAPKPFGPVTIGPGWTPIAHGVGIPARMCTVVDTSNGEAVPLRWRGLGGNPEDLNSIEVYSNTELANMKVFLICFT